MANPHSVAIEADRYDLRRRRPMAGHYPRAAESVSVPCEAAVHWHIANHLRDATKELAAVDGQAIGQDEDRAQRRSGKRMRQGHSCTVGIARVADGSRGTRDV